jgi:hypothetical protein
MLALKGVLVSQFKEHWQILAICFTLVGAGVAWTSYLQNSIAGEIKHTEAASDLRFFSKSRGELLEQRTAFQAESQRELRDQLKQIVNSQTQILQHLERLEARSGR